MMAFIRQRANSTTPQKHCAGRWPLLVVADPMVGPGNPARRHQVGAKTHHTRSRHRMVILETCPSGRREKRPSFTENATVMLALGIAQRIYPMPTALSPSRVPPRGRVTIECGKGPEAARILATSTQPRMPFNARTMAVDRGDYAWSAGRRPFKNPLAPMSPARRCDALRPTTSNRARCVG